MPLDPQRTVAELKELRALTGDENGAQRVAFTPTWAKARKWLREKVEKIDGVDIHNDDAGNFWGTAARKASRRRFIGVLQELRGVSTPKVPSTVASGRPMWQLPRSSVL